MTFLNDLWKKFKSDNPYPIKEKTDGTDSQNTAVLEKSPTSKKTDTPAFEKRLKTPEGKKSSELKGATSDVHTMTNVLNDFEQSEMESLQRDTVLSNLKALKVLVDQPKEEKPELRFTKIKQHLGDPECHETVRQERWHINIHCPNCHSSNLKRLPQIPPQSVNNHRYRCLACNTTFNDDTDAPMEKGMPPLSIWMQCWYLMGCTDSLAYIAAKLNLDVSMIEGMVQQLQKFFNAKKPLTRFLGYEEWNKQSQHLRTQLKEDLLKQYERLNANVAIAPKDTAEFRRQQNIRRGLSTIEPPSPTPGKKR